MPLTSKALVDEQEFLELVDQLRVAVPEEVRHAKRVSQDRERVLTQARVEADKVLTSAQEQALQLVRENEIVRAAQQQAQEILSTATAEAQRLRADADSYVLSVLEGLENDLGRLLATVKKGKSVLERKGSEMVLAPREPIVARGGRQ